MWFNQRLTLAALLVVATASTTVLAEEAATHETIRDVKDSAGKPVKPLFACCELMHSLVGSLSLFGSLTFRTSSMFDGIVPFYSRGIPHLSIRRQLHWSSLPGKTQAFHLSSRRLFQQELPMDVPQEPQVHQQLLRLL